jgi:hypothetical protein
VAAAIVAPGAAHPNSPAVSCGHAVSAKQSQPFIYLVWDKAHWKSGSPGSRALIAWHHKLKCAGPANRAAMKKAWQRERLAFGRYRALRQIAPYPGGGTWWAVPYSIVLCESGGSWSAYNPSGAVGPYQLLGWGAPYPARTWREKMENHRIAARVYAGGGGASNWVCA